MNVRVIVLKEEARLRFKATLMEMLPGDFVNIPAHTKHRVEWTTPDDLAGRILRRGQSCSHFLTIPELDLKGLRATANHVASTDDTGRLWFRRVVGSRRRNFDERRRDDSRCSRRKSIPREFAN